MEPTTGAILIVGHFIVSVFQFSLGNPVFQFTGYPTMEVCKMYAEQIKGEFPINEEYKMIKQTTCMTKADYDKAIEERNKQLQQQNLLPLPTPPLRK